AVTASAADMIAEAATGNTYGVNCQCISLPLSYRICVCQIRFQGRAGRPQGITYSHQRKWPRPRVTTRDHPYYTTKRSPSSMHRAVIRKQSLSGTRLKKYKVRWCDFSSFSELFFFTKSRMLSLGTSRL